MRVAVFIAVALSIWSLEHLYVGWRLLGLPVFQAGAARASLQALLVVGWLAYPVGRIVYAVGWHASGRMLEYLGAVWMGIVFLVFGALLAVDIVALGGRLVAEHVAAIRAVGAAVAVVAALFAWVCAALGPRLVEYEVRLAGLPLAADGTVLVQLSDVHLGTILGRALAGLAPERAVVLLQHAPEREKAAADSGVDLMLNGHTHGGQLWPFHALVRMAYPNYAGRYQVDGMTQIVSRGTGQWGPPMRLFAPAEIIRITLRSGSATMD